MGKLKINMGGKTNEAGTEHNDYAKGQILETTFENLVGLDLANFPDAQKHLILFLSALGYTQEEISNTVAFQSIVKKQSYADTVKKSGRDLAGIVSALV